MVETYSQTGDKDTMPDLNRVHLLKYGDIALPNGDKLIVDDNLLTQLVTTYDPNKNHEAPAILGHDADKSLRPNDGAPAHGWLTKLYKDAKGLFGDFSITEQMAEWIQSKLYKKLSISFYPASSPMSPVPGKAYIRHVAFLGAEPPVVKGLEPYILSEQIELMTVDITESPRDWLIALLADGDKGYKDEIVAFKPEPDEENNYLVEGDAIKGIFVNEQGIEFDFIIEKVGDEYIREFKPVDAALADEIQNEEAGLNTEPSEMAEELIDNEPYDMNEAEAEDAAELAELRRELAEMRNRLEMAEDMKLMAELNNYTDDLYKEGRLMKGSVKPAELSEFMFSLAKQDSLTVKLSETEQDTALNWFKKFVNNLPKPIEMSEIATMPVQESVPMPKLHGNVSHDTEQYQVHSKVIALCEQKGLDYKDPVSYRSVLKEVISNAK